MKKYLLSLLLVFVIQISNSQNFDWVKHTSLGNFNSSNNNQILTDNFEHVYVTGTISDTTDFDFGIGVFHLIPNLNTNNSFIAKYDSSGNFIWAKLLNGTATNNFLDIKIDNQQNICLIGRYIGTIDFDPSLNSNFSTSSNSIYDDAFVLKLDSSGNFIWVKKFESNYNTLFFNALTLQQNNNLVIAGHFSGSIDFDPNIGISILSSSGNDNTILLNLNSSGNLNYAKQLKGQKGNSGKSVACDNNSNIYLTGDFIDTVDFDPSNNTFNVYNDSINPNIYVEKFDANGNFQWVKTLYNTNNNFLYPMKLALDLQNNIIISGGFGGTFDANPGIGISNLSTPFLDNVFVIKFNNSGNFLWGRNFGNINLDPMADMEIDNNNNVLISGRFYGGEDFDPSTNNYIVASGSYYADAYINFLDPQGNFIKVLTFKSNTTTSFAYGDNISLDNYNNLYVIGGFVGNIDFDPSANNFNILNDTSSIYIAKLKSCGTTSNAYYSFCDSTSLWGTTYYNSDQFVKTFSNSNGCDSIVNVYLTIGHSTSDTINAIDCKSFTINNITYSTSGNYLQQFQSILGCDSSKVINLTLNSLPISIIKNGDTLIAMPNNNTYQWIDCKTNTLIAGATNQKYVPLVAGNYKVIINFNSTCADTTACYSMPLTISENNQSNFSINLIKKSEGIYEILNSDIENIYCQIYNIQGEIVFENNSKLIDISNLSHGLYLLKVISNRGVQTFKLLNN